MHDSDKVRFFTALSFVARVFGEKMDKAIAHSYWVALNDLGIDDFEQACDTAAKKLERWPRPAHILKLAGASHDNKRSAAWDQVDKVSRGALSRFTDPRAAAAVARLGGIRRIKLMTSDQFHVWYRKEFEAAYELTAEDTPSLPPAKKKPAQDPPDEISGKVDHKKLLREICNKIGPIDRPAEPKPGKTNTRPDDEFLRTYEEIKAKLYEERRTNDAGNDSETAGPDKEENNAAINHRPV